MGTAASGSPPVPEVQIALVGQGPQVSAVVAIGYVTGAHPRSLQFLKGRQGETADRPGDGSAPTADRHPTPPADPPTHSAPVPLLLGRGHRQQKNK
jgi:hypothetical protein